MSLGLEQHLVPQPCLMLSVKGTEKRGQRSRGTNREPRQPWSPTSSQLLTFLGIRSQDLSKCSSSKLWRSKLPSVSSPLGLPPLFATKTLGSESQKTPPTVVLKGHPAAFSLNREALAWRRVSGVSGRTRQPSSRSTH